MLNQLTPKDRIEGSRLIQEACTRLGVPSQRGRQVLYWNAHTTKKPILNLDMLKERLAHFEEIITAFNQEITLQQLRRQRSAEQEELT